MRVHASSKRTFSVLCLGVALLAASARAADEDPLVENPIYASWAKHKPGTSISGKMTGRYGDNAISARIVSVLLEVTPEKVVVEESRIIKTATGEQPKQTKKEEVPAKIKKSKLDAAGFGDKAKVTLKPAGESKMTIGDKTYDCKINEYTSEEPGDTKTTGTVWENDEVPGRMVKLEATGTTAGTPMAITLSVNQVDLK